MATYPLRNAKARLLPWLTVLALLAGPAAAQNGQPAKASLAAPCPPADHFWEQIPEPSLQNGQNGQNTSAGVQPEPSAAPAIEKSRKLSRTFKAPAGRALTVDTRYGRVQINTWARNEVKAEVDIISRADNEQKAQQLLDMIQVLTQELANTEGGITLRTQFGEMPRECWSRQRLYEVNYTIWMPKSTPLKVRNNFGDVTISGDLTGTADLALTYGTLRTGRLDGPRNSVRVNNSAATVQYARQASIDASYSRLRLDAGHTVDLRNNGSDIDMGTVQDLAVHSKYGDVSLGTVRNLQGSTGYSRFSVDKVSEQLNMKVQYCPNFEVRTTGPNFRSINVDGGYSTILLNFPDDAGFLFDVNAENGKLLIDKRLVQVKTEESSASSSEMQGRYGTPQAKSAGNVNVKARYSSISFNR
ncbi:hypothetical protein F0P96_07210 [Hymenobacter busanensis]|uniref:Uncharacterized protein n=1 Tax=Hymenobacter busanensis TaxID=2607656 RepID=A0A7L5A1U2_9BACT|nr:hypothetical protein [Hymenobacter busanensis]KAA9338606.1 hypothetical protein F0P96_07210 [Hymenobacter busanensis]QHJ08965.1 hypothetical protein GUY19_17390 [Hymenobacter busanensis]